MAAGLFTSFLLKGFNPLYANFPISPSFLWIAKTCKSTMSTHTWRVAHVRLWCFCRAHLTWKACPLNRTAGERDVPSAQIITITHNFYPIADVAPLFFWSHDTLSQPSTRLDTCLINSILKLLWYVIVLYGFPEKFKPSLIGKWVNSLTMKGVHVEMESCEVYSDWNNWIFQLGIVLDESTVKGCVYDIIVDW